MSSFPSTTPSIAPSFRPSVVFLDRDGTLIEDTHFISDPDDVRLLPGAAAALKRINKAGIPAILVTNQSGIGRGYFTMEEYERVHARLIALLTAEGAHLDGAYVCPDPPGNNSECRKPASGMFRQALREHHIGEGVPVLVGDRWRDVAAAAELGGLGFVTPSSSTTAEDMENARQRVTIVDSLGTVVDQILSHTARIAVFASGGGSNLQALLDYFAQLGDARSGTVVLVASNKPSAKALDRARQAGVAALTIPDPADGQAILDMLAAHHIDLVVLAGYLRLAPQVVTEQYRHRVVNVHPGPLPRFGGAGMYGAKVHAAVLDAGVAETGVTVHFVDERYDHGAVITHWPVPVIPTDTPDTLAKRVLAVEHVVFPRVVDMLAATLLHPAAPSRTSLHSTIRL